jgi:hypothetical protein
MSKPASVLDDGGALVMAPGGNRMTTTLTDVLRITIQNDLVTSLTQSQILESVQHDLAHTVALVIRVDDDILDMAHNPGVAEEFTLDDQAGGSDDLALILEDNDKVGRGAGEEIIETRFVHLRGQRRSRGQCGK